MSGSSASDQAGAEAKRVPITLNASRSAKRPEIPGPHFVAAKPLSQMSRRPVYEVPARRIGLFKLRAEVYAPTHRSSACPRKNPKALRI
jgi:hypothetical protein